MAGQTYQRTLLLKSNAQQSIYSLNLNVQTAPMPLLTPKGTVYPLLLVLLIACWSTVWVVSSLAPEYDASIPGVSNGLSVLAIFGSSLGLQVAGWLLHEARLKSPAARLITMIGAVGVVLIAPLCLILDITPPDGITTAISLGLGAIGGSIVGTIKGLILDRLWQQGFQPKFAIGLSLLTGLLGIGLGLIKGLAISNPWMTFGVIANGIGIGTMLTYLPIRQAQAIALYRRNVERSLIRP